MKKNKYIVAKRRKREGKTNYHKRLKLLVGRKTRFVVRISLRNIVVQCIEYQPKGDVVRTSASTQDLKKLGWKGANNSCAAYLCGLLAAKRAVKAGITTAVLDIGLSPTIKGSRVFAAARGARDGGLALPVSDKILPDEKRVYGEHIAKHTVDSSSQYAAYKKNGLEPTRMTEHVHEIKNKIMEQYQ